MRALFDDAAVVQNHNMVCIRDCRDPVRDHDERAVLAQIVERLLDQSL